MKTNLQFKNSWKFLLCCVAFLAMHNNAWAQPWTYDFGTGTGTANNGNAGSGNTALFTGTPANGGTYRVRIGTGGGSLILANPGTTLGTGTEAQLISTTGASTNKFGVSGWTAPASTLYLKFKLRNTSAGNGVINLSVGNSTVVTDNNGYTNHYNNSLASLRINYASGAITSVSRRTSGADNTVTGSGLAKDTDQVVELFLNDASTTANYVVGGTGYTLNAQTWDMWVDGIKISPAGGWAKAGTLAANTAISGFAFFAEGSTSNAAAVYMDDFEYNTALPANAAPTAAVNAISGTLTVGQTLTGSYTYNDTEGNPEGTSTFRWFRADNAAGLNVAPIAGETASTYLLAGGDANKYIRFGVTPVATLGTSPGVEAYSAYAGPVTTGTNAVSTITVNGGFTPATNVDYSLYTGTNVTGSSFEIARFNVNDITGAPDDGLSTTLTDLTMSLSNSASIEKVAVYDDTNTEIQELTAAATLNFTALNITAASGASKSFSVRVTFKTAVTDNAQPQLTITSATAAISGSFFTSANAGGAASSVSGNDNRIEVTATVLAYIQQPVNTVVNANMSPAVSVKAVDANNNTDADFTATVAVTSTGTLSTAQNIAAVAGIAAFPSIVHTVIQSGITLTANSTGVTGITSNSFDIGVQAAGELLFEENFDYSGALASNGYTTISGLGTNNLTAGATGLTYAGYGSTGIGNALALANTGHDVNRPIAQQNAPNTVYAAFLVNISASGAGDYFFALTPSSGSSNFRGRLFIKTATAGFVNFGIANTGTSAVYGTTAFATGSTHLVVLKYHYETGVNAIATLFIDPNLYAEPVTGEVAVTDAVSANIPADINAFVIRQGGGAAAPVLTMDGIRIATNWGTALGNPQYNATATINSGNYNSVNVISGTVTAAGNLTVNNAIAINSGGSLVISNNNNLIQKGTVNNNSGDVTVYRNASMKRQDYVYWSSPVAGQGLLAFSPATLSNRFYTIDEATNAFQAINPSVTDFAPATGYSIRAPNDFPNTNTVFNGVFVGTPNNGDISIPVTNSNLGFNLIGNPYASTIDADDFLAANTSVSTIYFWTHMLQGAPSGSNYATYNGTGATSATGSEMPNGTIQVGQGFMVETTAATNVSFTNSMRVNNNDGQFFRSALKEKNRIWLNLSDDTTILNQALIGYITDATNGTDSRFDGKLVETQGTKLYNVIDNSPYVIQGRALPFAASDVVVMGFTTETAGTYKISLDHVDGLFEGDQDIFLKDNLTGAYHNIKSGDYSFATAAGTFSNRFEVVYQSAPLGTENPVFDANTVIVYNQDGVLNINSGANLMQSVKIFDIRGRLLSEKNNINANVASFNNLNAAQQLLIVQVTGTDGQVVSKKAVN